MKINSYMMNPILESHSISIANAIDVLNKKGVIAYPTESVFGIGCDPDNEVAINRLLKLKNRPMAKGLIIIAIDFKQIKPYIDYSLLTSTQLEIMFSIWPAPVTFVFPAKISTPHWLKGRFNSLAARVTNHPLVTELCRTFGKPIVSTSANLTGLPPCRTAQEVRKQFGNTFPIINGNTGGRSKPSEIRNILTGECFRQG